jgi:hypothetical protein
LKEQIASRIIITKLVMEWTVEINNHAQTTIQSITVMANAHFQSINRFQIIQVNVYIWSIISFPKQPDERKQQRP